MFTEILYKTKLDQVLLMYYITYLYSAGIRSKGGNWTIPTNDVIGTKGGSFLEILC